MPVVNLVRRRRHGFHAHIRSLKGYRNKLFPISSVVRGRGRLPHRVWRGPLGAVYSRRLAVVLTFDSVLGSFPRATAGFNLVRLQVVARLQCFLAWGMVNLRLSNR